MPPHAAHKLCAYVRGQDEEGKSPRKPENSKLVVVVDRNEAQEMIIDILAAGEIHQRTGRYGRRRRREENTLEVRKDLSEILTETFCRSKKIVAERETAVGENSSQFF